MWLAIFGMLLPSVSFGASPTTAVHDVALRADHSLHGRVVDLQGKGRANLPVSIIQAGNVVGKATTDADGRFVMADLKGGKYSLQTAEQLVHYRAWANNAAPPTVMDPVIYSNPLAHAHGPLGGHLGPAAVKTFGGVSGAVRNLLSSPIGMAAVAAAIAVPIAVDNDNDAS